MLQNDLSPDRSTALRTTPVHVVLRIQFRRKIISSSHRYGSSQNYTESTETIEEGEQIHHVSEVKCECFNEKLLVTGISVTRF